MNFISFYKKLMNPIPEMDPIYIPPKNDIYHIDEKDKKSQPDTNEQLWEIFAESRQKIFLSSETNSFYADLASFIYTQLSTTIKNHGYVRKISKSDTKSHFIEDKEKETDMIKVLEEKLKKSFSEKLVAKYISEQIWGKSTKIPTRAKKISENDLKKADEIIVILWDKADFKNIKSMDITKVIEDNYSDKLRTRSFSNKDNIEENFHGIRTLVEWLIDKDIDEAIIWYSDEEKKKIKKKIHILLKKTFSLNLVKYMETLMQRRKDIIDTLSEKKK